MDISANDTNSRELYKILIGAILPRPIAWVSSMDPAGNLNLAPFSFFTVASVRPPILCFSPLRRADATEKDTLMNVRATREFVINIVSENLAAQMIKTSGSYGSNVDEFDVAQLPQRASRCVKPPGVADSLVNFECALRDIISLGTEPLAGNLVLGEVLSIHVSERVYQDGRIDTAALAPIGRLAGNGYATVKDRFEMVRPN